MNEIQAVKTAKIEEVKKNSKKGFTLVETRSSYCNPCSTRSYRYSCSSINNQVITDQLSSVKRSDN